MENSDLSNLPLLQDSADSGEYYLWLTAEQNTWANFSGLSAAVSTPEQAELLQPFLTDEEELSEQRVLADFDISLLPSTRDRAKFDEPEDPFAALAAYRPLTFDDNSQPPSDSELGPSSGFFEGFPVEDLTDLAAEDFPDPVLTEPEGHDVLDLLVQPEQPEPPVQAEQSQDELDERGIIIPESAAPDTVSEKLQGSGSASDTSNMVISYMQRTSLNESIEMHFPESLRRSERPTKKSQESDSAETESLSLPQGMVTRSEAESAARPKKSATPRKYSTFLKKIWQSSDESLHDRVNRETEQWIVKREGEEGFMCSYPNCGYTSSMLSRLRAHIFKHIRISVYKCTYPECIDHPYFRDPNDLRRHVKSYHMDEKPFFCEFCGKRFARMDSCKRHMFKMHKLKS